MKNNSEHTQKVVTRFAPSPTGLLHSGNYRTALFSYLYARQHRGKFILRIEDTDRARSKKEYEDNIIESLKWLGLEYDALYRQSEQLATHQKYLNQLIADGKAYISKEPARDSEGKPVADTLVEVVRFKNPGGTVRFHDLIRGDIEMDVSDLKDFVIAKNLNEPLFHLAVVVDDFTMGVTHIVRGEDHISNTPRQILIGRAIGAPEPYYAHLPLILADDRSKLSKRKGARAITEYRDQGFLPSAMINYLALLGWNPGTEQEILSLTELITQFDMTKIQKGGAVFSEVKLRWINKEYIRLLPEATLIEKIAKAMPELSLDHATQLVPIIRERISTLGDIDAFAQQGEFVYLYRTPVLLSEKLLWKKAPDISETKRRLQMVASTLSSLTSWTKSAIEEALKEVTAREGKGEVLWPLRYALTGKDTSPDPFTVAALVGKDEAINRIRLAISQLS
ncbi:MAG: glutamate--tRNA ligase [Patescibacteria group bacterium]